MKYIESFSLVEYALSALKHKERAQVSLSKVNEVKLCALQINKKIGQDEGVSDIKLALEQLIIGLDALSGVNVEFLTDDMKTSLLKACINLRNTIAKQAYAYYMDNKFVVNETTIPLMREIIAIATGGEYI